VTLRKAAQQALVAMKSANHVNYSWACVEAVAVLEAALAKADEDRAWVEERKANWAEDKALAKRNALEEADRIRKAEEEGRCWACGQKSEQEPVAWMYDFLNTDNREEVIRNWVTQDLSDIDREKGFNVRPLYTTPPQRKPLTINEVEQILAQHSYAIHGDRARYIVRMTEAAHGIGEKK